MKKATKKIDENEIEVLLQRFFMATPSGYDSSKRAILKPYSTVQTGGNPPTVLALDLTGTISECDANTHDPNKIYINDSMISEVFYEHFDENLTNAEFGLLKGLLCAKSLKTISELDGVSYETRRNQLKSILQKSGMNRQTDMLVAFSTKLAMKATNRARPEDSDCASLQKYLERHYPREFRVYSFNAKNGKHLLIGEYGPINGRPCIVSHSAFMPIFPLPQHSNILNELNIRVITPYRPGFFELSVDPDKFENEFERYLESLEEFVRAFGLFESPVISHAFGSTAMLKYLSKYNHGSARIVICSPAYIPRERRKKISLHVRALIKLAKTSPQFSEKCFRAGLRTIETPKHLVRTLSHYFGQSQSDMTEYARNLENEAHFLLTRDAALGNVSSLVAEFALVDLPLPNILRENASKSILLYGDQDNYANFDLVRSLPNYAEARFEVEHGLGRSSFLYQPRKLFSCAFD